MLNNKSLANCDCINEELFVELTSEEGAAISGGLDYQILNQTDRVLNFYIFDKNFVVNLKTLTPNEQQTYTSPEDTLYVLFDEKFGDPFQPKVEGLSSDKLYRFNPIGEDLILSQGLGTFATIM